MLKLLVLILVFQAASGWNMPNFEFIKNFVKMNNKRAVLFHFPDHGVRYSKLIALGKSLR